MQWAFSTSAWSPRPATFPHTVIGLRFVLYFHIPLENKRKTTQSTYLPKKKKKKPPQALFFYYSSLI